MSMIKLYKQLSEAQYKALVAQEANDKGEIQLAYTQLQSAEANIDQAMQHLQQAKLTITEALAE